MALCGGFRPRCPSARLSEGSISRSLPISCSCWDNGTLPPALSPFPVFSVFSGRCARHVPAGQKGGSFSLFQRLLSWQARAPSPLPRPLLWDLPDHCLLTVPSSLQTGSCFLVQSNKHNPLPLPSCPSGSVPSLPCPREALEAACPPLPNPYPPTASWPCAAGDPGKGSSGWVPWGPVAPLRGVWRPLWARLLEQDPPEGGSQLPLRQPLPVAGTSPHAQRPVCLSFSLLTLRPRRPVSCWSPSC